MEYGRSRARNSRAASAASDMAIHTNGRVRARDVLELGSLLPETRPVSVIRDGATVMLAGYPKGDRCTLRVLAAVSAASRAYAERIAELAVDGRIRNDDARIAQLERIADLLCAVIPGLEMAESEVLAADDSRATGILASLGWWQRADGDQEDADSDENGPTPTPVSTGSFPDLAPSTARSAGST